MDPLTLLNTALEVTKLALTFGLKIYDDTPLPIRQQGAADWGKFIHGIAADILNLQQQVNSIVKVPK